MPLPTDTAPEIGRLVADAYRRMPLVRKWEILGETFATARMLHAAGVRLRDPGATPASIDGHWLATSFGYRGQVPHGGEVMSGANQNLTVLREVLRVLTQLDIVHALGGSMASSLYGVARFTRDADLTVEPFPGKEEAFAAAFGPDYYLSLPAIRQAVAQRSSFNVLHTREGFKVDLFVRKDQPFEESALKRRIMLALPDMLQQALAVLAAEDVLLFKLLWYRLGQEVSAQQWTDVIGVLRVQKGHLDEAYLDHWAAAVNVMDLLARARAEVDSEVPPIEG
jgi:hypothetical protein